MENVEPFCKATTQQVLRCHLFDNLGLTLRLNNDLNCFLGNFCKQKIVCRRTTLTSYAVWNHKLRLPLIYIHRTKRTQHFQMATIISREHFAELSGPFWSLVNCMGLCQLLGYRVGRCLIFTSNGRAIGRCMPSLLHSFCSATRHSCLANCSRITSLLA